MKDISQFLMSAPKGLSLYSSVFGNVVLHDVSELHVAVRKKGCPMIHYFDQFGRYLYTGTKKLEAHTPPEGECVLFPSEKNRSWDIIESNFFENCDGLVFWNQIGSRFIIGENGSCVFDAMGNRFPPGIMKRFATTSESLEFLHILEKNGKIFENKTVVGRHTKIDKLVILASRALGGENMNEYEEEVRRAVAEKLCSLVGACTETVDLHFNILTPREEGVEKFGKFKDVVSIDDEVFGVVEFCVQVDRDTASVLKITALVSNISRKYGECAFAGFC